MEMNTDGERMENDDAENTDGKDIYNDSAVPSSVNDGTESPRRSQSSDGRKKETSSECPVVLSSGTPKGDPRTVPNVVFKKGQSKAAADQSTVATNAAFSSDDVATSEKEGSNNEAIVLDIPDPMGAEASTKKHESATTSDAVVGRCNDAMDADHSEETSF